MDALEWVQPAIAVLSVVLGAAFVFQQWNARRRARDIRPVAARVLCVSREENPNSRTYPWTVVTSYDVPGLGALSHTARFENEGKAILFARLHKEGTSHSVVPDASEPGTLFLREELARFDWSLVLLGGLFALVLALVLAEYLG